MATIKPKKNAKPEKTKVKPAAKSKAVVKKSKGIEVADIKTGKKLKKKTDTAITTAVESKYPLKGQKSENIRDEGLAAFTERELRKYGSYVVEDRAIPDFRDGLKPVHRAIIWAMSDLNLLPSGGFKKSARVVGDALGKYHPHGDSACYGAMVTVANTVPPAVDGQGNWGTPTDPFAAMRYTEAKQSRFTQMFLLDKNYLQVTPMVSNFSNDMKLPLHLPALLPFMLFAGTVPAPAYGVKCGNPTFTFASVARVVIDMLNGIEYDHKKLAKTLVIQHEFGCKNITSSSEMLNLMRTGRGKVTYEPEMKVDLKRKTIVVQTFVPLGFASEDGIEKMLMKFASIQGVSTAHSVGGERNPDAGTYGCAVEVVTARGVDEDRFYEIAQEVQKLVTKSVSYILGVTVRHADKPNSFKYLDYLSYFKAWVTYRKKLEVRMLDWLIARAQKELHLQEVYLFAVENKDKLLKALPKVLASKTPDEALAKAIKLPVEDAKIILDRQVRKLATLEKADLVAKIKSLKSDIAGWQKGLKAPGKYAGKDTEDRVVRYLKNPDENKPKLGYGKL